MLNLVTTKSQSLFTWRSNGQNLLLLKGSKLFIIMFKKFVNVQNIFCYSFHSQNEYIEIYDKDERTFLSKGNFYLS